MSGSSAGGFTTNYSHASIMVRASATKTPQLAP
jgi:hypothetical protein